MTEPQRHSSDKDLSSVSEFKLTAKFYLGCSLLVISFILPLAAFVVPFLGLHPAVATAIVGTCVVGGPEIGGLLAIAILGKETFDLLIDKAKQALQKMGPPKKVSRGRYYFGLAVNIGSIVPLYLSGYLPDLLPRDQTAKLYLLLSGEIAFLLSFFILGGEFWEKFKKLFVYEA
jgi:hypothetical protein